MSFKIALAQCKHPADGDVIHLVRQFAQSSSSEGAELLVFPESLMTPFEKDRGAFLKDAEPITGTYAQSIDKIAAEFNLWICYTINELNESGNPFNTAVVTDPSGRQALVYRKVHLFDSATTCESERMSAGSALPAPIETSFSYIGIGICYDLRFPEVARTMALKGANLMLYPAAWVSGEHKVEQWQTLLKARAIENEMFVAGLSRCDDGYIGSSCVIDPFGNVIAQAGADEELLLADIDLELVSKARDAIPVFNHRHPELYGEIVK